MAAAASQQVSCNGFICGSKARAVKVKAEPTENQFISFSTDLKHLSSDVLLCQMKSEIKTEEIIDGACSESCSRCLVWTVFKSTKKPHNGCCSSKKTELEQYSNTMSSSTNIQPVKGECIEPHFGVQQAALNADDSPDIREVLCTALIQASANTGPDENLLHAISLTNTANKRHRQNRKCVKPQGKPAKATCRKQKVDQAWICTLCGKSFTRADHLKIHMRIHTGEKPYKCTECEKCFARSGELDVHKRFHRGEKPYGCSVCGKRFSSSTHLKEHEWTHTGTKPHACTQCEKSFAHAGDLVKHRRIHTGERPYPCVECGMAFRRAGTLKKHQKRHLRVTSFHCVYCKKIFCFEAHLQKHMTLNCKKHKKA